MEDPEAQVKAVATLGDTVSKLKSAGAKLMPEADRLGVQNLAAAGFDVRGMASFFERLQRNSRSGGSCAVSGRKNPSVSASGCDGIVLLLDAGGKISER